MLLPEESHTGLIIAGKVVSRGPDPSGRRVSQGTKVDHLALNITDQGFEPFEHVTVIVASLVGSPTVNIAVVGGNQNHSLLEMMTLASYVGLDSGKMSLPENSKKLLRTAPWTSWQNQTEGDAPIFFLAM